MSHELKPQSKRYFSTLFVGFSAFVICWTTFVVYYEVKFDLDIPPSTSGDEVDYDSIGWELAQGRGFAVHTENPAFREPYDLAAQNEERFQLARRPRWHITYRPPLYPYAISFLNRVSGRQFWATRAMDAAFMAGTLAMIAVIIYRSQGLTAVGISVLLFMVVDTRTRLYGRAILTEAMSLFLTSVLCVLLFRFYKTGQTNKSSVYLLSVWIGVVFGLSLLTRTMMITWVPGIALLLLWLNFSQQRSWKDGILAVGIFGFTLTMVFLPWAIRNIEVTGKFMPLGTQGQVQLSAAFGDIIWKSQGEWRNLDDIGFFDDVITEEQSPLEQELAKAEYSKQVAKSWVLANPIKSFALVPMKLWQECRPRSITEFVILLLAAIGVWRTCGSPYAIILLSVFAINLMGVAATWSVQGRFLVPLLFPIHIMATFGCYEMIRRIFKLSEAELSP